MGIAFCGDSLLWLWFVVMSVTTSSECNMSWLYPVSACYTPHNLGCGSSICCFLVGIVCLSYGNSVVFWSKDTVVKSVLQTTFPNSVILSKKLQKPLNETHRCQENMEHLKGKPSKLANYSQVTNGISRWWEERGFLIKSTCFNKEEVLGNSLIRLIFEFLL